MAQSLKERYEIKRLQQRVQAVSHQLVLEQRVSQLIIEAMDEEDFKKVTQIIEKLNKLKHAKLPALSKAIDSMQAELNKVTSQGSSGPLGTAKNAITQWFKKKAGLENPIVKIMTFANALEHGFSMVPQILKNNGIDLKRVKADKNTHQSITDIISGVALNAAGGKDKGSQATALSPNATPSNNENQRNKAVPQAPARNKTAKTGEKSDEDLFAGEKVDKLGNKLPKPRSTVGQVPHKKVDNEKEDPLGKHLPSTDESVQNEADNQNVKGDPSKEKIELIQRQLVKALTPTGNYSTFRNIPYIKVDDLVKELVNAPVQVFSDIVAQVQSGPQTPDVEIPNEKITGQGAVAPEESEKAKQAQTADSAQPTKGTAGTTGTTPTGESPPGARGGDVKPTEKKKHTEEDYTRFTKQLKPLFDKFQQQNIAGLVDALEKAGLDFNKLETPAPKTPTPKAAPNR